ncbi:MAG: radical SAM protein [Ardenticatenaceae bacterium]
MITVQLVNDPQQHDFRSLSAPQVMPDCDCACPVDDLDVPTLDMPTFYSLELTPSCNNRCPGCSNVFFEDVELRVMAPARRPMPFARWREVLAKIAPYATRLKVTGGEATLHPDFELIIEEIERLGIKFTLFTNARWLNPPHVVEFLRDKETCAGLLISLHGATAEAHEAFTGIKGSFEETIANIRLATAAGITVHTSCVFTSHNVGQLAEVEALSERLGGHATVFNRYIGQAVEDIRLTPQELAMATRQVDQLYYAGKNVRFGTCIPLCFVESTSTGCLAGTAYCTLDPWGNMRPCNHTPWLTGNILSDSLEKAWNSAWMNQFRQLIPDSGCTTCSLFSKCRGGCRADAILNGTTKDPLMRKPALIPLHAIADPSPIRLYRHAKTTLIGEVREQKFGYLLVNGDKLVPVTEEFVPCVSAFGANPSLQDIYNHFGQPALDFTGELYEQGLLSLAW